jgi:hypothetical protein
MAEFPLPELFCDPQPWMRLYVLLQTGLNALPSSDWTPAITPPADKATGEVERARIKGQLLAAYKPHVETTSRAIFSYLRDGQWPALQPPDVYYLKKQFCAVLDYLDGIVVRHNEQPKTIFPFPPHELGHVAVWFLLDWWTAYGVPKYLRDLTTDEVLFHQYFS